MKTFIKIIITTITYMLIVKSALSVNVSNSNSLMIVDSIEIKKQQVNDFYNAITSTSYIPVNFIDKNLIDNLKSFNNIMKMCRQIEQDIEIERHKTFIIIDQPSKSSVVVNDTFPIG